MVGITFLLLWMFLGIVIQQKLFGKLPLFHWILGSLTGIYFGSWVIYLSSEFFSWFGSKIPFTLGLQSSFTLLAIASTLIIFFQRKNLRSFLPEVSGNIFLLFVVLLIASALMFSTFGFNDKSHQFFVKTFVLSDFSHHIPLIRSFSLSENIPPQAPLFAGENIRYHFLFYLFVGALEKLELPIHFAINLPSALGFIGFLVSIFFLIDTLFSNSKNRALYWLTLLFTLTSSSLAFYYGPSATWFRSTFLNSGPYYNWNENITGLFWTLTIFTNQRHLAFGIALGLFALALLLKTLEDPNYDFKKDWGKTYFIALLLGALPFFHGVVFTSVMMILAPSLLWIRNRKALFLILLTTTFLALPQLHFLAPQTQEASPHIAYGYGLGMVHTWKHFFIFWIQNLGLKFLLLPLLYFLPKLPRNLLLSSLLLFLVPNIVQFGPDVWTNHKFFNLWVLFLNIGFAYLFIDFLKKDKLAKFFIPPAVIGMTLSGLLDIPPIFRDEFVPIYDWKGDSIAQFLYLNSEPREAIVTSYRTYNPANLVGRPILLGWPYFSWSAGFDTKTRELITQKIFETKNPKERCGLLNRFNSHYIVAGKVDEYSLPYHPDLGLFSRNFTLAISDPHYLVFDTAPFCKKLNL